MVKLKKVSAVITYKRQREWAVSGDEIEWFND